MYKTRIWCLYLLCLIFLSLWRPITATSKESFEDEFEKEFHSQSPDPSSFDRNGHHAVVDSLAELEEEFDADEFELPQRGSVRFMAVVDADDSKGSLSNDALSETEGSAEEIPPPLPPKSLMESVVHFFSHRDFTIELYFLAFYAFYFVIYYFGSRYNLRVARNWYSMICLLLLQPSSTTDRFLVFQGRFLHPTFEAAVLQSPRFLQNLSLQFCYQSLW